MKDSLSIKHNVRLTGIDSNGNVVYRHEGHNIWLDGGRTWIALALRYRVTGAPPGVPPDQEPDVAPVPSYRREITDGPMGVGSGATLDMPFLPFYMGVGIGGNQQTGPIPGSSPPVAGEVAYDYPGTNVYSDADPTVPGLERPVRVATGVASGSNWARWLMPFSQTAVSTTTPYYWVKYTASFDGSLLCAATMPPGGVAYPSIPLSEIALYRWDEAANGSPPSGPPYDPPGYVTGAALAYHTFPTFNITAALTLVAEWSLVFA